jgi:hypothetical protein
MGFAVALFSISGKIPEVNEVLQKLTSGVFINCTHFFTVESVTSSNPDEYFHLRFFITIF